MSQPLVLHDLGPERDQFLEEALDGLTDEPKTLPCKYFYDERGSQIFDRICELEEYYPTRTELSIMEQHGAAMGANLGPRCLLVEYGSGSSLKTRLLLAELDEPVAYVPVDISREHLQSSAKAFAEAHPSIPVLPVCADFTEPFTLPEAPTAARRSVVYFPGSTIGNLGPEEAHGFLGDIATQVGHGGGLLIGVDLEKDRETLERAYDDGEGVTAAFNKNVLARINRELGADFDLDSFDHRAHWSDTHKRVEMHLVARKDMVVRLDGVTIEFAAGETIHTENSHKYSLEGFADLARRAGFEVEAVWTDTDALFSVQSLRVA